MPGGVEQAVSRLLSVQLLLIKEVEVYRLDHRFTAATLFRVSVEIHKKY